jgi:hypothetical protein
MIEQYERFGPDLVIYEGMHAGAGVAASVLGIPAATYAIALASFVYNDLHPATVGYQRDTWLQRNRTPPEGNGLLASALINPAPPTVRQADGTPVATIPIRSVAYNESSAGVPTWLDGPATRPRVYLTLGTVSFGAVEVLSRAIAEIAPLDVDVLVTVGPEGQPCRAWGGAGQCARRARASDRCSGTRRDRRYALSSRCGPSAGRLGRLVADRLDPACGTRRARTLHASLIKKVSAMPDLPSGTRS